MAEFLDARRGSVPDSLTTDICIAGAGAAGLTVALNLGSSDRVVVLEAGGVMPDERTQALYAGKQLGLPYHDLTTCRLRYFGGTTNHWAGYCRPNDPIDYEGRPDLGVPAWPVDGAALGPFIEQAARDLGVSPDGFDPEHQRRACGFPDGALLDRGSPRLQTKIFQITNRLRFGEAFRGRLDAAHYLQIVLHANVTHVQLDPDGRTVRSLTAATASGRRLTIAARRYVLACHAIENARLLLASDDVRPGGIGNGSGHVGRYFMEHPHLMSGLFFPHRGRFPGLYNYHRMLQRNLNANIGLSTDTMREGATLQYYCRFWPIYGAGAVRHAVRRLGDGFVEPVESVLPASTREIAADLPRAARFLRERIAGRLGSEPRTYRLEHRIEQAPDAESRVVLSDERDGLGSRRADLRWKLSDLDYHTFRYGHEIVTGEMNRLGLGRFQLEPLDRARVDSRVAGRGHHIGTTRMSAAPRDGVVDPDCRVHGVDNLYIAGSSVFPTAGYSGPTMMLMALALRLAAHLRTVR